MLRPHRSSSSSQNARKAGHANIDQALRLVMNDLRELLVFLRSVDAAASLRRLTRYVSR